MCPLSLVEWMGRHHRAVDMRLPHTDLLQVAEKSLVFDHSLSRFTTYRSQWIGAIRLPVGMLRNFIECVISMSMHKRLSFGRLELG